MVLPSINTGLSGINTGLDNIKRDAHDIASTLTKGKEDTADLAKSLIDLNQDRSQVEASVKVVQAVDEVLGTLLDIHA